MACEDIEVPFGKHRGKTLGDILASDPKYLDYLNGIEIQSPRLKEAVREINDKYAGEIQSAIDNH